MIRTIQVDNSFHMALRESLRAVSMKIAEQVAKDEGLPENVLLSVISRSTREIAVRVGNGENIQTRMGAWDYRTHCWARIYRAKDSLLFIPCGSRSVRGSCYCRKHEREDSRHYGDMNKPLPSTPEIKNCLDKNPVLQEILILHPRDPSRMIC
jgi:hypothetical protein